MKSDECVRGRIIRVVHGEGEPFTRVANQPLNDPDLDWAALGLLCYLLSKPDNWAIRLGHLVIVHAAGRYATTSAIEKLKKHGYLKVSDRRDSRGRFIRIWFVFETRQIARDPQKQQLLFDLIDELAPNSTPLDDAPLFNQSSDDSPVQETCTGFSAPSIQCRKTAYGKPAAGNLHLVTKKEVTNEQQQQDAAAATRRRVLQEAGIGEPVLSELAGCHTLAVTDIRREAQRCRDRGKGTGALVQNLRARAIIPGRTSPEPLTAIELERQREADADAVQQRDAQLAWLKTLDSAEISRLKQRAIERFGKAGDRWMDADPETNVGFRQALWAIAREESAG